jgi:hypothetical protein
VENRIGDVIPLYDSLKVEEMKTIYQFKIDETILFADFTDDYSFVDIYNSSSHYLVASPIEYDPSNPMEFQIFYEYEFPRNTRNCIWFCDNDQMIRFEQYCSLYFIRSSEHPEAIELISNSIYNTYANANCYRINRIQFEPVY